MREYWLIIVGKRTVPFKLIRLDQIMHHTHGNFQKMECQESKYPGYQLQILFDLLSKYNGARGGRCYRGRENRLNRTANLPLREPRSSCTMKLHQLGSYLYLGDGKRAEEGCGGQQVLS